MKKSRLPSVILLCILAAGTLLSCTQSTPYEERTTIFAYIQSITETDMTFDTIEMVDVPSDRATELGITDAPNPYYIHNESATTETLPFADNCTFHIYEWPMEVIQHTALSRDEFITDWGAHSVSLLYQVTIEGGEIIDIQEQYIP